jgi:hypothetical protein
MIMNIVTTLLLLFFDFTSFAFSLPHLYFAIKNPRRNPIFSLSPFKLNSPPNRALTKNLELLAPSGIQLPNKIWSAPEDPECCETLLAKQTADFASDMKARTTLRMSIFEEKGCSANEKDKQHSGGHF